jgi:hypothetical protein
MTNEKFPALAFLISQPPLNFCCLSAFFAANLRVRTGMLADRVGVSPRIVRWWRKEWKEYRLTCKLTPTCVVRSCPSKLVLMLHKRMKLAPPLRTDK